MRGEKRSVQSSCVSGNGPRTVALFLSRAPYHRGCTLTGLEMASATGFPIWRATFPKHTGRIDPMRLCFSCCWISLPWAVQPQLPGPLSPGSASAYRHHQQAGIGSAGLLRASEQVRNTVQGETNKRRHEDRQAQHDTTRSAGRGAARPLAPPALAALKLQPDPYLSVPGSTSTSLCRDWLADARIGNVWIQRRGDEPPRPRPRLDVIYLLLPSTKS
ncbi:hypothetical protein J3F83DRAFT_543646 [Trichoderma novae-zelandiae]